MGERQWGVRLADVRLPRWCGLAVIVSVCAAHVVERRQLRELRRIGRELGEYVGKRDLEAAEREALLLALTRLTWALLFFTEAALVVGIVALAQG